MKWIFKFLGYAQVYMITHDGIEIVGWFKKKQLQIDCKPRPFSIEGKQK